MVTDFIDFSVLPSNISVNLFAELLGKLSNIKQSHPSE